MYFFSNCTGPENILPPQKGLEFPGDEVSQRPKHFKRYIKLNWDFYRDRGRGLGGVLKKRKAPQRGRSGYFLDLHIINRFHRHATRRKPFSG